MTRHLLGILVGFAIGSLPVSYALVKWRRRIDLRKEGSGNVGTMNVLEVTRSPALGIAALLADTLKGTIAVLVAGRLISPEYWVMGAAGAGAVAGHIWSPWLGFSGGRGLATAFGVTLVLGWIVAAIWIGLFAAVYTVKRDIHIANVLASLLLPAVAFVLPDGFYSVIRAGVLPGHAAGLAILIGGLTLAGHSSIILQYLKSTTTR